jgi:hypothetical protein
MLSEYPPFSKSAADGSPEQSSETFGLWTELKKKNHWEKNNSEERGAPIF